MLWGGAALCNVFRRKLSYVLERCSFLLVLEAEGLCKIFRRKLSYMLEVQLFAGLLKRKGSCVSVRCRFESSR